MGGVLVGPLVVGKQQKTGLSQGELLVHFMEQPGFRYGWTQGLILGPCFFFLVSLTAFLCSSFPLMLPCQRGSLPAVSPLTFPAQILRLTWSHGPLCTLAPEPGPLICHVHPHVHRGKTQDWVPPHLHDRLQQGRGSPQAKPDGALEAAQAEATDAGGSWRSPWPLSHLDEGSIWGEQKDC